jgi:hypothetical protein
MRVGRVIGGLVALAAGVAAGLLLGRATVDETTLTETVTDTRTVTETETQPVDAAGLPEPVARTYAALLEAAESGDVEQLRSLLADGFRYSFGGPVEGGAIGYWQELERTGARPLQALAAVLRLPYTLSRGLYVWPFAYDLSGEDELTAHERGLLETLGGADRLVVPGTGYLGWRAGIEPDGDWVFFLAGD